MAGYRTQQVSREGEYPSTPFMELIEDVNYNRDYYTQNDFTVFGLQIVFVTCPLNVNTGLGNTLCSELNK